MRPVRVVAILFMLAVVGAMVGVIALLAGAFHFVRHEMVFGDAPGEPVAQGLTKDSRTYQALAVSGPIELTWSPAAQTSYTVSGPHDLVSRLRVRRNGQSISFGIRKGADSGGVVKIDYKGSAPNSLSVAGSGAVTCRNLAVGHLVSSVAGSGKVVVTGKATSLVANVAGSGEVEAFGLDCDQTQVSIAGSGSLQTAPKTKLSVNIMGSGDVVYKGNPAISRSIMGSGSVRQAE